jgi:multimeric flavodoxin WrbA
MIAAALEVAKEKGFETDAVFLSSSEVAPCKACGACREKDCCILNLTDLINSYSIFLQKTHCSGIMRI